MIIIGITGTLGAGKGTIVEKLKKSGFKHYSVRDFLVEQIRQRGLEVNRDSMRELANELREKNGADYIVECLVGRAMAQGDDCVIESIRNPKEVETLRRIRNFHLFSVDADIHKRYERIRSRKSSTDNVSFETFVENEKKEMSSDNESGQNLSACMALADFRFNNDKDIEDLDRQVEDALKSIEKEMRPSWDEYFMDLANAASKRATCDRGRSGCVIVKDRHILSLEHRLYRPVKTGIAVELAHRLIPGMKTFRRLPHLFDRNVIRQVSVHIIPDLLRGKFRLHDRIGRHGLRVHAGVRPARSDHAHRFF